MKRADDNGTEGGGHSRQTNLAATLVAASLSKSAADPCVVVLAACRSALPLSVLSLELICGRYRRLPSKVSTYLLCRATRWGKIEIIQQKHACSIPCSRPGGGWGGTAAPDDGGHDRGFLLFFMKCYPRVFFKPRRYQKQSRLVAVLSRCEHHARTAQEGGGFLAFKKGGINHAGRQTSR